MSEPGGKEETWVQRARGNVCDGKASAVGSEEIVVGTRGATSLYPRNVANVRANALVRESVRVKLPACQRAAPVGRPPPRVTVYVQYTISSTYFYAFVYVNALTDVGCTRSSSDRANQMVLLFRVSKLISPDQNNYANHKISIINIKIYNIYFFLTIFECQIFDYFNCVKYVLHYFIIKLIIRLILYILSFSHYLRFI